MTLIAGFIKDGCPILTGDLLLSTQDNTTREIFLPTTGIISKEYLSKAKYKPCGLCQKVNLLSSNLAVAWAGSMDRAREFMRRVIEARLQTRPSYAALQEIFNQTNGTGDDQIAIIGIYRDGKEMRTFSFNASPVSSTGAFEYFRAEGSGANTLVDIINHGGERITSGNPNNLERAVGTAITLDAKLLSEEILTRKPLEKAFGAGYEILHPLGQGFSKFNDLTYGDYKRFCTGLVT